jgi:hypothetical protein
MTMSLVRGMSTNNTRKRRVKKSARQLKAEKEHEAWLESMGVGKHLDALYDKYGRRIGLNDIPDYKEHQATAQLSNRVAANGAAKEKSKYTGTEIIGYVVTHKSNLMPVRRDNKQAAIDAATMRRN